MALTMLTTWETGVKPPLSARKEGPTVSEILGSRHNCRHHGFGRTPIFSCSLNMGFWFPVLKNLPANAGDTRDEVLIPVLGRSPGVGNGNPFQYFLPGIFHGQRSLVGYSPWGGDSETDSSLELTDYLMLIEIRNVSPKKLLWNIRAWRNLSPCSIWQADIIQESFNDSFKIDFSVLVSLSWPLRHTIWQKAIIHSFS